MDIFNLHDELDVLQAPDIQPDTPDTLEAPQAPQAPQAPELPEQFCVKKGRNGYFLLRWSNGGLNEDNKIIHILKPSNHQNRYYNIRSTTTPIPRVVYPIVSRKHNGQITRLMRWQPTQEYLLYNNTEIPVIIVTPLNSLPSMTRVSYIPLIPTTVPAVPVQVPVQVAAPVQRYIITSIPQHIVRALLRDAAMNEEVCPITSEEIDISNGAVTSCFHIFEKNAIMKWLSIPNSYDKCPVCNHPCDSYSLDEPPPLDTTR
jgi:hypothetical protein